MQLRRQVHATDLPLIRNEAEVGPNQLTSLKYGGHFVFCVHPVLDSYRKLQK